LGLEKKQHGFNLSATVWLMGLAVCRLQLQWFCLRFIDDTQLRRTQLCKLAC